jgi:hypothetical protein
VVAGLLVTKSGNANDPGSVGGSPGKSCLFFVRLYHTQVPGIGLAGDRDVKPQSSTVLVLSGARPSARKGPGEWLVSIAPGRTHIRSRSPR